MSEKTKIEWADVTWNPIVGCSVVSPGCTNCYAMRDAQRLDGNPKTPHYAGTTKVVNGKRVWTGKIGYARDAVLSRPLTWERPRTIFVNSMGDLFHEDIPKAQAFRVLNIIDGSAARARDEGKCGHRFLILTKRAERMRLLVNEWVAGFTDQGIECPAIYGGHLWLGVSAEDQTRAEDRVPALTQTAASIRFVSAEPLLGPLDLAGALGGGRGVDWIIAGGESGPDARPMHPDWARDLRDQCQAARIAFHFKQWGEWLPWEPEHAPCWQSQNGQSEDHHALFPVDICDDPPGWDSGLSYVANGEGQAAFQRVGKKAAGRELDGRTWDEFPRHAERSR